MSVFYLAWGLRGWRPSEDRVGPPEVRNYCATGYMSVPPKTSVRPPGVSGYLSGRENFDKTLGYV